MDEGRFKSLLTAERINKAVDSISNDVTIKVKDARFEILREDRYTDACAFMRDHFIPDEPLERSIGLSFNQEYDEFIRTALKEHLSLALISEPTGEIIGVRLIHIFNKPRPEKSKSADEKIGKIYQFLRHLDKQCDIFHHYNVDETIRFLALGVHRDFRQRGLGTKLMQAGVQFVKSLDLQGVVIKGEGSSNYSKRIYEKLGFDILAEVEYERYKVDGEVVFKNMGEHKSAKLYGHFVQ